MDDKGKRRWAARRRTPRDGAPAPLRIPKVAAASHKPKNGGEDRDGQGRFAEGNRGGPGRRPGSRNRTPAMLREAFLNAFDDLGAQAWLVAQAKKDSRTFIRCVAKMLPREATIHAEGPIVIPFPDLPPERVAEIEAGERAAAALIFDAAKKAGEGTHPVALMRLCDTAARYFGNLGGHDATPYFDERPERTGE